MGQQNFTIVSEDVYELLQEQREDNTWKLHDLHRTRPNSLARNGGLWSIF